jgi:ATP-dependent Clp protease ATP-binding subunit ClpA
VDEVNARALIAAVQERALRDDPLVLLETAVSVAGEVSGAADGVVEHYVGAARAAGLSWTLIGERLGVSKQAARQRFAHRLEASASIGDGTEAVAVSPRLSACLQAAQAAADADGSVPGTHHLLLGLLHAGDAASVLDRLGVTRDKVSQASARLLEPMTVTGEDGEERRIAGDGEAGQAITAARRLATQGGLPQVRTGHLLFCIVLDPGSSARRILNDLGIDPAQVKKELAGTAVTPVQRRHRRYGRSRGGDRVCSFCGCTGPLVPGPGVWICGGCAQTALDILHAGPRGLRTG